MPLPEFESTADAPRDSLVAGAASSGLTMRQCVGIFCPDQEQLRGAAKRDLHQIKTTARIDPWW